jgi:hypothetical protein
MRSGRVGKRWRRQRRPRLGRHGQRWRRTEVDEAVRVVEGRRNRRVLRQQQVEAIVGSAIGEIAGSHRFGLDAESEHNREPDHPMGTSVGMAGRCLADHG